MIDFIDDKEFRGVKQTIYDTGGDVDWKLDLIEFINDETDVNGKEYFFYMLPCVRFINEEDTIAYTTKLKAICLNAPNKDIKTTMLNWYFIYLHECLHQLWDTFGAEDEIRNEIGECNGYIMNIASDCVINDFLRNNVHFKLKYPSDDLVTPQMLKEKYGVTYNNREDTQTSLYMKLIEVQDKILKNPPPNIDGSGDGPKTVDKKSDDYVKGWNQAIEDYNNGKLKI